MMGFEAIWKQKVGEKHDDEIVCRCRNTRVARDRGRNGLGGGCRRTVEDGADKKAISKSCSDQANAKGLHGKERKHFRSECKRHGGKAE